MVSLWEIPPDYRKIAEGIPPDVLGKLSALDATARCVASKRWHNSGVANPEPATARAALGLSFAVLSADPAAPADYRAKAVATSDPVLRSGYYAAAEGFERDNPAPSAEDRAEAGRALVAFRARPAVARRVPSRADRLAKRQATLAREIAEVLPAPTMIHKARKTAAEYRALADQVTDPMARQGYLQLAEQAEKGLRK